MVDAVVNQARIWGFFCEQSNQNWQICAREGFGNWTLEQAEDRWILSIRGIPQIYLYASEAIAFLELRYHALPQEKDSPANSEKVEE
ncbi:MAG: hypothetical protein AB4290_22290 [Spirulina sp.]